MKQFGNFVLDIANECLWNSCTQIALQPKPFAVLRYLADNPGRLITHRELLEALWQQTYVQPQVLRTVQVGSMITNRLDKKYANSLAAEEQIRAGE